MKSTSASFNRLNAHRPAFVKTAIVSENADGEKSKSVKVDCNDAAAQMLREIPLCELYAYVADQTGLDGQELFDRYCELNPGQQRMNLGNKLRTFLKKKLQAEIEATRKELEAKNQAKNQG
jgi:hypothetical protein